MDEFLDKAGVWLDKAIEFAKTMTIEEWGYVAGGLIIIILLRWIIKRARRPKRLQPSRYCRQSSRPSITYFPDRSPG